MFCSFGDRVFILKKERKRKKGEKERTLRREEQVSWSLNPPVSASQVLGLEAWGTIPGLHMSLLQPCWKYIFYYQINITNTNKWILIDHRSCVVVKIRKVWNNVFFLIKIYHNFMVVKNIDYKFLRKIYAQTSQPKITL